MILKPSFKKLTDPEKNVKCKNGISSAVFGQGDLCFIVLSTWPCTEKGTLLVERYLLTKLGRKKQGQKSCPRAKKNASPMSSSCYSFILLQYGKTLYDNYKCAVRKAGLSSQWANQKVVEPAAPAGSSSAGTDTVTAVEVIFIASFDYVA